MWCWRGALVSASRQLHEQFTQFIHLIFMLRYTAVLTLLYEVPQTHRINKLKTKWVSALIHAHPITVEFYNCIYYCVRGLCLPWRCPQRWAVCVVCRVLPVSHRRRRACRNTFLQMDTFLYLDQSIYTASYCKTHVRIYYTTDSSTYWQNKYI